MLFLPFERSASGSSSGLLSLLLLPRYFGLSSRHTLLLKYTSFIQLVSLFKLSALGFSGLQLSPPTSFYSWSNTSLPNLPQNRTAVELLPLLQIKRSATLLTLLLASYSLPKPPILVFEKLIVDYD